jgi:hypothetical protein
MSLRAHRAAVMAAGSLLSRAAAAGQTVTELVSTATDLVDDGLALARDFEARRHMQLRPLAARLFRLGAQLYGRHQPQFLAEFLLENLRSPSLGIDAEFQTIAYDAIAEALAILKRPHLHISETHDAKQRLATARSLRAAQSLLRIVPSSLVS